jgi:hypothetical protein
MGMDDHTSTPTPPTDWQTALHAEMKRVGLRRPWGRALMAVAWVHLLFFSACQAVYYWGHRSQVMTLSLWALELGAVLLAMRRVAGRDWIRESPGVALVVRIWITFLILSFNVASLNRLTGWTIDWFKPAWCTLASFGFATLAWLFGVRFLIWAVQMYFTGLLMVAFPHANYLINALSWFVILHGVGRDLEQSRARGLAEGPMPIESKSEPEIKAEAPPAPLLTSPSLPVEGLRA